MPAPRRYPHRERMTGKARMRQFSAYVTKILHLGTLMQETITDTRRGGTYDSHVCFLLVMIMLLQRYRSFNAFEDVLSDPPMRKLLAGYDLPPCVQTIKDACKKIELSSLERLHQIILRTAANNKVMDRTRMHGSRFFAFDGVEPFASKKLSCKGCHSRVLDTAAGEVTEYYHRYVFLQSIGPAPHLLMGFEPQASSMQRKAKLTTASAEKVKAEGELTAVKPLVERLRSIFPRLFVAGVGDALFSNGPMLTFMRAGEAPLELIAILKNATDEPMADAITVFARMQPEHFYDPVRGEHVLMWDSEGFEGLSTCPYPVRVIKALVHRGARKLDWNTIPWDDPDQVSTWWMVTGIPKTRLGGQQVFDVTRHRWDEENCAFNDLTQNWNFKHSYLHHEVGTQVMMYAFLIAFNLFQLFLYRCLRRFSPTITTAVSIAGQMKRDAATITDPHDGFFPPNTS
jgi:hypothetical protein